MAIPELLSAQRDFSAGELDAEMKRRDDLPIYRAGGRQMRDWRVLNSGVLEQRPGRRALYTMDGRVDQAEVAPAVIYDLCFRGDGSINVRDSTGVVVAGTGAGAYPWTRATVSQIVWTQVNIGSSQTDIVITFPGMKPAIANYNAGVWTFSAFAFSTDGAGVALVPFYRVTAPGATMTPSATGAAGAAITAAFSSPVLVTAHVGALFRFANRRLQCTAVANSQNGSFTCLDALFRTQQLTITRPDGAIGGTGVEGFSLGQVVRGSSSEAEGEVVGVNIGANTIAVQLTNFATGFLVSAVGPPVITELVIGPSGKSKVTGVADIAPLGAVSWDEQIVSDARGWPQSCTTDDSRLIFCDLPSTPEAIIWSATNQPFNFNVGVEATDAICEPIAGKPRVYHVGPWIDELVFTNKGIYYIPINTTNPLKPGSVTFQRFSPEAASTVKPIFTSDGYLYVNEGRNSIKAIIASGAAFSTRPYAIEDITQFHRHLFAAGPVAIALATGDGQVPERYVYVVNADGTMATGKLNIEQGKTWVGWMPWTGSGLITWISALHSAVRFVSRYQVGAVVSSLAEVLDDNQYLDGAILINAPPAAMSTPPGFGALWWLANGTVELIDGVRPMGTHSVDATGFVIPAYEGEDLDVATITGGLPFVPYFEPFIPNAQPGEDKKQRTVRRNLGRLIVSVKNSTGLVLASLYSGKTGPQLPAQGDVTKFFRVPPWNQDDDRAQAPPLREETYRQRFTGRAFDQRVAAYKDVPGPIQLIEVATEASV